LPKLKSLKHMCFFSTISYDRREPTAASRTPTKLGVTHAGDWLQARQKHLTIGARINLEQTENVKGITPCDHYACQLCRQSCRA
jgi:hypothetical protein